MGTVIDTRSINPFTTIGGLFAQTVNSEDLTNTTSEKSLIGGGLGTLTVPANGFKVGDSYRAFLTGHISSVNNEQILIKVKTQTGVIFSATILVLPAMTNKHWSLEINFTIRALGTATNASIAIGGVFLCHSDSANKFIGYNFSDINAATFDTTILNELDITAEWNTADSGNSIYSELFVLSKTY